MKKRTVTVDGKTYTYSSPETEEEETKFLAHGYARFMSMPEQKEYLVEMEKTFSGEMTDM